MTDEGKYFFIKSKMNGMALQACGGRREPNKRIETYPLSEVNNDNQLFYNDPISDSIRCKLDDFCLDMNDDDAALELNEFDLGKPSQRWMINGDRVQNREDGRVLDIAEKCEDPGARICAWDPNDEDNQQWEIEYAGRRYFYIVSLMHGKVVDVKDADEDPGASMLMYDKGDRRQDNQIWYEDKHGHIHTKLNDMVIDSGNDGIFRTEEELEGCESQDWLFIGDKIVNRQQPTMVAEVKKGRKGDKVDVVSHEFNDDEEQFWEKEYV